MEIEGTIRIRAPVEAVFDLLANHPERNAEWNDLLLQAWVTKPGAPYVGRESAGRGELVMPAEGVRQAAGGGEPAEGATGPLRTFTVFGTARVLACDPPHRLEVALETNVVRGTVVWQFEPAASGTRLIRRMVYELSPDLLAFFGDVGRAEQEVQGCFHRDLERIKGLLEREHARQGPLEGRDERDRTPDLRVPRAEAGRADEGPLPEALRRDHRG